MPGSLTDFVAINTDPATFNPALIGLNTPDNPVWKSVNFTYRTEVPLVPEASTMAAVGVLRVLSDRIFLRRMGMQNS